MGFMFFNINPAHKSELDYTGSATCFDLFGRNIRLCCLHCIFLIDTNNSFVEVILIIN